MRFLEGEDGDAFLIHGTVYCRALVYAQHVSRWRGVTVDISANDPERLP